MYLSIGLNAACSGMGRRADDINRISHNLSNMETTGYHKQVIHFEDLMYLDQQTPGANIVTGAGAAPVGLQVGMGVKTAAISRMTEGGSVIPTGGAFDLAIQGQGYFSVQMPDGTTAYTRAGVFRLNEAGQWVTTSGYILDAGIQMPQQYQEVHVTPQGDINVVTAGGETQTVGSLTLSSFPNPGGLKAIGENLFTPTEGSGAALTGTPGSEGLGRFLHRHKEGSNVDPVQEITDMIKAQRGYDMIAKVIQAIDEMLATVVRR